MFIYSSFATRQISQLSESQLSNLKVNIDRKIYLLAAVLKSIYPSISIYEFDAHQHKSIHLIMFLGLLCHLKIVKNCIAEQEKILLQTKWQNDTKQMIASSKTAIIRIVAAANAALVLAPAQSKKDFFGAALVANGLAVFLLDQMSKLSHVSVKEIENRKVALYGQGQVKQVYVPLDGSPYAYYLARRDGILDSFYSLQEKELRNEVHTANRIKFNLFKADLTALFEVKKFKNPAELVNKLLLQFDSVENLLQELETNNFEEKVNLPIHDSKNIKNLKSEISYIVKKERHLAIHYSSVPQNGELQKYFIVKTFRAKGDLESEIVNCDFQTKIRFIKEILEGWTNLHEAGCLHGDPKLENILVFEKNGILFVALSDFGKAAFTSDDEDFIYLGNSRHEPNERRLSKKGEVFSAAIILIRILEEEFLDSNKWLLDKEGKPFIPFDMDRSKIDPKRKGIEKFALANSLMTQHEAKSLRGKMKVYSERAIATILPYSPNMKAEKEIGVYIDALTDKLHFSKRMLENEMMLLRDLLKDMTRAEKTKRPLMEKVHTRFCNIQF